MMSWIGKTLLFLPVFLVTCILLYLSFNPVRLVHIHIQPDRQHGVRLFTTDILVHLDSQSVAFFDVRAYAEDPSISKVSLYIRPSSVSTWYPHNFDVSDRFIIGTAQLGSSDWPLNKDEHYTFRLETKGKGSGDGRVLSDGKILASVYHIAGAEPWFIGGIGLLASGLQIISFFWVSNQREE